MCVLEFYSRSRYAKAGTPKRWRSISAVHGTVHGTVSLALGFSALESLRARLNVARTVTYVSINVC